MIKDLNDFYSWWKEETAFTLKIFAAIPDQDFEKVPAKGLRSPALLCFHLAHTTCEMMQKTGLPLEWTLGEKYSGQSKSEIMAAFEKGSEELVKAISSAWNNDTLEISDNMYGENWKRGLTLQILITHLIHHRGQLTAVMRMLGARVPGIYGPAQEEWVEYGLEPHP